VKYKLVYTRRAVKDIEKLDEVTRARIAKSLARFENEPFRYAGKLTDPNLGTYRFRVGDYRVIFDVEGRDIVLLRVGHRRELYKRT
jgi:mRNA interferase RelE/StbE